MKDSRGIQGGPNSRRQRIVLAVSLLASLCVGLFAQPVQADQTSTYRFLPGQSTITQTGGIAGIHRTYTITGIFQLTLDSEAGTASFDRVDAKAVDDSPDQHILDPNDVFNMTELSGVIIDRTTIGFEGTADDGSSILITLTFADDTVGLKGGTTPPPNSADLFIFTLDAQAARVGQASTYGFLPYKSTITQTGGIAGIHRTYTITGTFQLTADFDAGTASFDGVDANAVDDSPFRHTLDPNEVFNMTELSGTIIDRTTTRFEGTADDGSSVLVTLTFADGTVSLKGGTTPPPNSADFFVLTLDAIAARKYAGGTGESDSPYLIYTPQQMNAIGAEPGDWDKHFKLMADIDLSGCSYDKAPIAPDTDDLDLAFQGTSFMGVFDGNGKTLSHLTITGGSYLGLFGRLESGAEVRNLGVLDVTIAGADYVGALVGFNRGRIATSHTTGMVSGNNRVGGFTGRNWGSITTSYNATAVTGNNDVGGITAGNYGDITTSYNTGPVTANTDAGGLVGENYGSIATSYSTGTVSGQTRTGGLVGSNGEGANITTSFWDVQTSGLPSSDGGVGKTTAEMQMASTFTAAGWDFVGETANGTEDVWRIVEGKDYPRLWWQLPADDFQDGKPGPLWFVYEVDPSLVQIKEVNGRLETTASAEAQNVDAFYVSDGWRLDTTKDFAIKVDFHFSKQGGGDGRVTLGVVPSLDPSAMQWAELEAGCFDSGPFYLYEVRDGSWVQEVVADRSSDGRTLYMSYNPDTDELYFSHSGYGKAKAWQTVTGLLKGHWASKPVYVILGGGSEGMALTGADAWLDNLVVSSGLLILN